MSDISLSPIPLNKENIFVFMVKIKVQGIDQR